MADAMAYSLISAYFMFFLTTIAGIRPQTAGIITAVGAVFNGLMNPVIGYMADRIYTRWGRRRPVMIASAVPLSIAMILAFTNYPFSGTVKAICYGLILMLYWASYSGYLVPYLALASGYTSDYDERTKLRLYASLFNQFGSLFTFFLPTILVDTLKSHGLPEDVSWTILASIISVICFVSIVVTFATSRKQDPPCEKDRTEPLGFSLTAILREYAAVAALPPVKYLVAASITALICFSIMLSDLVYFLTYNMEFSALMISVMLGLRPVFAMGLLPIVGTLSAKIDKRQTFILLSGIGVCGMILLRVTGVSSIPHTVLFILMATLCTGVYWHLVPSMYLDICDYDRLMNGVNRQATILSFQGFVEAIAAGFGTFLLGFLLEHNGFDGEAAVQQASALTWIFHNATWVPCLFLAVAMFCIWRYPMTRDAHHRIISELTKQKH